MNSFFVSLQHNHEETIHHQTIIHFVTMKPYTQYTAEELAVENLFIRWVKCPKDTSLSAYWENWVKKYPDKAATVSIARNLVLEASKQPTESLQLEEVKTLWERIKGSVENLPEIKPVDMELQVVAIDMSYYRYLFIMVFIILLCVLYLFVNFIGDHSISFIQMPFPIGNHSDGAL